MLKSEKVKISVKDVKFVDYLKSRPYSNHVINLWCLTGLVQEEFNTNFVVQAVLDNSIIEICMYKTYDCHNHLYFKLNCNPYEDTVEEVLKDIYKILMNGDKLKEGDNIFEKYSNFEIDTFETIDLPNDDYIEIVPPVNYDLFYKYFNKWIKEEDSKTAWYSLE